MLEQSDYMIWLESERGKIMLIDIVEQDPQSVNSINKSIA